MEVQPFWKTEAVEGKVTETKFDKWTLLAQVVYQIVVWDTPVTKKLQRTQDLLAQLTPEEKEMFQITLEDEEKLGAIFYLIKYYNNVLSAPSAFTGQVLLTNKVLTAEEKRNYMTRPKKWGGWVCWDKRNLTYEGKKKFIEQITEKRRFTLFGVLVDPKDVYCKLKSSEQESDGWDGRDKKDYSAYQSYPNNKKFDFGNDDPLIWRVNFYVRASSLLPFVKNAYKDYVLKARNLIGNILQRMMKQLEGKTVYVIPEERKIP